MAHADKYFGVIDYAEDEVSVDVSQVGSGVLLNPDKTTQKKVVKSWSVNQENFYFLIQRLQFCEEAPAETNNKVTVIKSKKPTKIK